MECGLAILLKPWSARKRTCIYLLFVYVSLFLVPLIIFLTAYHRTTFLMFFQSAHGENNDIRLNFTQVNFMQVNFVQVLTGTFLEVQLELVDAFHAAMNRTAMQYFIYCGTLLGSWRHHGLIPWDDVVHVVVPFSRQKEAQRVLDELRPRYYLNVQNGNVRWKFFSNRSLKTSEREWAWPHIDINFYISNTIRVWDHETWTYTMFNFRYEDVFPLRDRPFMNRMLPAPVNTEVVLKKTYDLDMCRIGSYDHKNERFRTNDEQITIPCKELESTYAFVRRVKIGNNRCNETLMLNKQVIGWFLRDFGTC